MSKGKDEDQRPKVYSLPRGETIPVKYLYLHAPITWPGHATSETTINDKKMPGLSMVYTSDGVIATIRGGTQGVLIPLANIRNIVFDGTFSLEGE